MNLYPFQILTWGDATNKHHPYFFVHKYVSCQKGFRPFRVFDLQNNSILRSELDLRSPRMGEVFGAMIRFPTPKEHPLLSDYTFVTFFVWKQMSSLGKKHKKENPMGDRLRHFPRFGVLTLKSQVPPFFPKSSRFRVISFSNLRKQK